MEVWVLPCLIIMLLTVVAWAYKVGADATVVGCCCATIHCCPFQTLPDVAVVIIACYCMLLVMFLLWSRSGDIVLIIAVSRVS